MLAHELALRDTHGDDDSLTLMLLLRVTCSDTEALVLPLALGGAHGDAEALVHALALRVARSDAGALADVRNVDSALRVTVEQGDGVGNAVGVEH